MGTGQEFLNRRWRGRQKACAVSRVHQNDTLHVSHVFLDVGKPSESAERTGRGRSIEHYAAYEVLRIDLLLLRETLSRGRRERRCCPHLFERPGPLGGQYLFQFRHYRDLDVFPSYIGFIYTDEHRWLQPYLGNL